MTKVLTFVSLTLACILLPRKVVHAAPFECSDEPAACKTKFATQLEKDFRQLQLTAFRKLFESFVERADSIKSEFPPDYPYSKSIEETRGILKDSLQRIHDNENDNTKVVEAIVAGMESLKLNFNSEPRSEDVNFSKAENFRESLLEIFKQMLMDTRNLWYEMYAGLREEDVKAYPEYTVINEYMERLRGTEPRGTEVIDTTSLIGSELNLPYLNTFTLFSKSI